MDGISVGARLEGCLRDRIRMHCDALQDDVRGGPVLWADWDLFHGIQGVEPRNHPAKEQQLRQRRDPQGGVGHAPLRDERFEQKRTEKCSVKECILCSRACNPVKGSALEGFVRLLTFQRLGTSC